MNLQLTDNVVLIAGGSRGIGFAIAKAFHSEGAKVALTARDGATLAAAAGELTQIGGEERVTAVAADMTDITEIDRAMAVVEERWGVPDTIVANVGSGTCRAGYELSRETWQEALDVNLLSGTLLASVCLPKLTELKGGTMTFVSSIAGVEAIDAPVPYAAAKAALVAAMKSYSRQVGKAGVRVNAVAPGNVLFPGGSWETKMSRPERKAFFDAYIKREVALQRFAAPREIADVVTFLASPRASFVTGTVVVVDGGQTRSWI